MTTLADRPGTALLVIDVQVGVVRQAHDRDAVLANIGTVVEAARAGTIPIVWVQHESADLPKDSDGWRIAPELRPAPGETIVHKLWGDAFEDTPLESILAGLGAGRLIVTGAQTDACIRSTLHGAMVRGYDTVLVADGHTTEDLSKWGAPPPGQVIRHTNLYWAHQTAPGRTARVVKAADLDLAE